MPLLAVRLDAALIFAEGEFARALLDAGAVHALDEPSAGQHHDPLRRRVLVPLRVGGTDAPKLVAGQSALALMTDAVLVHVEVPVWNRGLGSGGAHRGFCAVE